MAIFSVFEPKMLVNEKNKFSTKKDCQSTCVLNSKTISLRIDLRDVEIKVRHPVSHPNGQSCILLAFYPIHLHDN